MTEITLTLHVPDNVSEQQIENMIGVMTESLPLIGHKYPSLNRWSVFDKIRTWAKMKGILDHGDAKTQTVKMMEEAGELARAVLLDDKAEIKDAIGDIVVVLTSVAHHAGFKIENCVESAYQVIANRKGKMENGNFVKEQ